MKTNTVKGFNDYTGDEARKREKIKKIIQEQFELYGFEPAETPIVEYEEFVKGENENDEAVRDVFKLEDRGKRKLALRYEFTFQLKRLAKQKKLPYRRYQIGYVFRDEPIKKGRVRQFIQADADVVGSSVKDEAENFAMLKKILDTLKVDFTIYVNNRKLIDEILEEQKIAEKDREQVIREIDKLDKLSEKEVLDNLKKLGAEKLLKIFSKDEKNFEKYAYYKEIKELKKYCKEYGVNIEFSPSLARGLSYYNGMVFEIKSKELGVSIAGGGNYIVNKMQATGVSLGVEPLFLIADVKPEGIDYMVLSINQDKKAIKLAEKLRGKEKKVLLMLDRGISKALEYANSAGIEKVVFVGEEEVKTGKFKVKDMKSGKESFI